MEPVSYVYKIALWVHRSGSSLLMRQTETPAKAFTKAYHVRPAPIPHGPLCLCWWVGALDVQRQRSFMCSLSISFKQTRIPNCFRFKLHQTTFTESNNTFLFTFRAPFLRGCPCLSGEPTYEISVPITESFDRFFTFLFFFGGNMPSIHNGFCQI